MNMRNLLFLLIIIPLFSLDIKGNDNWLINNKTNRFIVENKGQFNFLGLDNMKGVSYIMDAGRERVYFKPSGVVYEIMNVSTPVKSEAEKAKRTERKKQGFHSLKEWQEFERTGTRLKVDQKRLEGNWIGANPNPMIIVSDANQYTKSYMYYDNNFEQKNIDNLKTYRTLTYVNIYPNIDIVYEIHEESGVKYSIVVHPGGDVSQVKLKYSETSQLNGDGSILTKVEQNSFIDHKPITFYADSKLNTIPSSYSISNNEISFQLGAYNNSKKIIIDPWSQFPTYTPSDWHNVWEVESDLAGNVYTIGGIMPLELRKYNAAGVQQWSVNTPYDTTGWLGAMATDDAGNSYVSNGSTAAIVKYNTGGGQVWNNPSPGGLFSSTEFWNIEFNCDQTKLVIGGTGGVLPPLPYMYNIDMNSGNVTASVQVTGGQLFPTQEVRSITPTENEKYYFLSHDSIGYLDDNFGSNPCGGSPYIWYKQNDGYNLSYKCENWRWNNSGIEAMAYYDGYIYINRGNQIDKRDFLTANIVATAPIPSGQFSASLGRNQVGNSGIAIDQTGNIFVGSKGLVVQFNTNLNQIATFTTPGINIYDVEIQGTTGRITACGGDGTSSSGGARNGAVYSWPSVASNPLTTTCCNPSICQVPNLCTTDGPYSLVPYIGGGTWTPAPGLNTATGVFDPAVAGPGTHTIYYTLACGTDSITITVGICAAMSICVEPNGDLTVNGGNPTYTWYQGTMVASCVPGFGSCAGFLSFTDPGPLVMQWTSFGTGTTITPPGGADTVMVVDNFGDTVISFDISTLPSCSGCDATITPAGPFCVNGSPTNLTAAQGGGTWTGTGITNGVNGTFNPTTAGVGSHVITYTLPSCIDTVTIVVNPLPTTGSNGTAVLCSGASAVNLIDSLGGTPDAGGSWSGPSGLTGGDQGTFNPATNTAGVYTYTVTNGCGSSNNTVTVSINPSPSTGIDGTASLCSGASAVNLIDSLGGTPDIGGSWSGPSGLSGGDQGTFNPATNTAGTYTYTITNSCGTSNNNVVVTINPAPDAGSYSSITLCPTDPATNLFNQLGGSPNNGGTWSGPSVLTGGDLGTFDPATNTAGTYTYTVTSSCGTDTASVAVTISPNPVPGTNGTASLCSGASVINLLDSLGGTPSNGGTWSGPSALTGGDLGTFNPASNTAGTYTYTVNDCSGNPQTADVVVTINPAPDAGTNGTLTICPTDPATDLFNQLGGSPNNGGTWSGPSALTGGDLGTFDPATNTAGVYTYTVTNSCGSVNATVTVTISSNPVPGTNGTATLCSNASSVNLLDSLSSTPSNGGTWSGPSALTGGDLGTFNPTSNSSGTYTYTVNDCSGNPQTADVVVTINPAPDAGTNGTLTICPTDPATDLFNQLGGSPNNGGTWSGPSALTGGDLGTFNPASNTAGVYTYTVTNSCGSVNATVTVTISSNPVPGTNGTATLCSNASSVNLLDSLGGTPSNGGTWSGPSALTGGDQGTFDPASNSSGTYTYTVNDCSGNPQTADVVVTIVPGPNAGSNGSITLCNTDPATDLFNQLGGTPDAGGTWSGPSALTGGDLGTFNPASNTAGTYTYTVTNSCGSASSTVQVTVSSCTMPIAGYTVSDSTVCAGTCVTFTDASSGATSWQWTFNGGSPSSASGAGPHTVCYSTDGTYNVELIVSNSNGSDTVSSTVQVYATPYIDAGSDVTINLGDSVILTATGTNGTYSWTPPTWLSCSTCPNPTASPVETVTYTVIVVDSNGCTASDDVTVFVDYEYVIWVPNIFSPNGDGSNDIAYVRGAGVADLQFFIYDRWGEKVFETNDLNIGWDGTFRGKKMNNAVFVYYLEATFIDGTQTTKKGDITLIR